MRDIIDDESLIKLFDIPGMEGAGLPGHQREDDPEALYGQGGLFGNACPLPACSPAPSPGELYRLSPKARNAAILAAMSEPPPGESIPRFCRKALLAGEDRVTGDLGDDDVRAVLEAAAKVTREIDRLRGLLRFREDGTGTYIARCAPDHFALPALAAHFELRFGETPWAIIDEKRRLALLRPSGGETRLIRMDAPDGAVFREESRKQVSWKQVSRKQISGEEFPWEELWRTYHRSANNESRENPKLQRQFMPARYWKYLVEVTRNK
jgi:probable DNA metabolism protein